MQSLKNLSQSLAVQSLGMGDQFRQSVEDELDEQKKRKLMENQQLAGFGLAANSLLGVAGGTGMNLARYSV